MIGLAGVMTAVVLLTVAPGTSDARTASEAFARSVTALSDRAVVTGRTVGLSADDQGGLSVHGFDDGWRRTGGIEIEDGVSVVFRPADDILPPDPVPKGTLVIYRPPGDDSEEEAPPPPVLFGPTGEATPFVARFEAEEAWLVTVGPFGDVEISRAQ